MKKIRSDYHGFRFLPAVISCAVRLSLRDVEELLLERGVAGTDETIRCWRNRFGTAFTRRVKAARLRPGSTRHLDEMFVTLRGQPHVPWHAVEARCRT